MKPEAGNALFLILIAVALFAALSYAVTNSGRSGGTIEKEKVTLAASRIIQHVGELHNAVNRLRVIQRCSDVQLSFWHDGNGDGVEDALDSYYNPFSPTDKSCHIYDNNGGAVAYLEPDRSWLDSSQSSVPHYGQYYTTANNWVAGVGTDGSGSLCAGGAGDGSCKDLLTGVPFLSQEICYEINRQIGWGVDSEGTPYIDNGNSYGYSNSGSTAPFTGDYNAVTSISMGAATPSSYSSVYSGCVAGDLNPASGLYSFFHVLLAR